MTLALAEAPAGTYRCTRLDADGDDAIRLKRLGVCQDRLFDVVIAGDPMVLKVSGSQIGVSKTLAELVIVQQQADDDSQQAD